MRLLLQSVYTFRVCGGRREVKRRYRSRVAIPVALKNGQVLDLTIFEFGQKQRHQEEEVNFQSKRDKLTFYEKE
jgi:hypothetical protein